MVEHTSQPRPANPCNNNNNNTITNDTTSTVTTATTTITNDTATTVTTAITTTTTSKAPSNTSSQLQAAVVLLQTPCPEHPQSCEVVRPHPPSLLPARQTAIDDCSRDRTRVSLQPL